MSSNDTTLRRKQHQEGSAGNKPSYPKSNQILGDYTFCKGKSLGAGSMGKVELATHNITGEKVRGFSSLQPLPLIRPLLVCR